MKYLGLSPIQYIQYLYMENYNAEGRIKDLNKWRDYVHRINIVKMSSVPNLINRYNTIPNKTLTGLFL